MKGRYEQHVLYAGGERTLRLWTSGLGPWTPDFKP